MNGKQALLKMTGAVEIPVLSYRRGIYFLKKGKEIVYVGKTEDITQRAGFHIKSKEFDSISFLEYRENDLAAYERAWIRILQPPLNVKSKDLPGMDDLDHLKRGLGFKYFANLRREIEKRYALLHKEAGSNAAIPGRLTTTSDGKQRYLNAI